MNAAKIRGILAEKGMSQKDLARRLGIAPQSFSQKITGKRQFTVEEATTICNVLSIQPEQRGEIFLLQSS